ncbi:hypothetical protein RJT34_07720 [Clitoria ternatea]|uniref:Uncharacterized protein n=1 Tax=Clitoria ternatea TaxID=43366 RepID=A0AAN9K656_CLITE
MIVRQGVELWAVVLQGRLIGCGVKAVEWGGFSVLRGLDDGCRRWMEVDDGEGRKGEKKISGLVVVED